MFSNSLTGPAHERELMFNAHAKILEAVTALEFVYEIILPPSGSEKLELSAFGREGLACNLKVITNTILNYLDYIPDSESSFKNLLETTGGKNND